VEEAYSDGEIEMLSHAGHQVAWPVGALSDPFDDPALGKEVKEEEEGGNLSIGLHIGLVDAAHPSLHELLGDGDVLAEQVGVEVGDHFRVDTKLRQSLELRVREGEEGQ
jgi:hypothetical protein